tara:strand:+ start:100 stop:273 length:174 start_codon:yes stop_codon:yes gene_type:complete
MFLLTHLKAGFEKKGFTAVVIMMITAQVQGVQRVRSLNLDLKTLSQKNRTILAKQKC